MSFKRVRNNLLCYFDELCLSVNVYDKNPERLEASYGRLVPILVKAVQELSAEVKQLKQQLNN